MSYYEWINNFEILQTSPMDENILKDLENKTIYKNDYIRVKLFRHVLDTVNIRLNNIAHSCLEHIYSNIYNIENLSLDFISLKKEKRFVTKISELPIFDYETRVILLNSIDNRYDDICEMIRKTLEHIDQDGNCIMTFEKIMSSNMEG